MDFLNSILINDLYVHTDMFFFYIFMIDLILLFQRATFPWIMCVFIIQTARRLQILSSRSEAQQDEACSTIAFALGHKGSIALCRVCAALFSRVMIVSLIIEENRK